MIFAIVDYFNFRHQRGRYSRNNHKEPMAYGFDKLIPKNIQTSLQEGDTVLSTSFDSGISWAIMYFTSSLISHVSAYIGNGQIIHGTLSGSRKDLIETLYGEKSRFIIVRPPIPKEKQSQNEIDYSDFENIPYSMKTVLKKLFLIVSGRDWPYYRWKFYFDILILFLLIDLPFIYFFNISIFLLVPLLLLVLIVINAVRWRYNPLDSYAADVGKPCDVLVLAVSTGRTIILDKNRLKKTPNTYKASRSQET